MSNLIASFRSLVKNNNGMFKSEKQAIFLLNMCQEEKTFIHFDSNPKTTWNDMFYCDNKGIVKVIRTTSNGKINTTFERIEKGMSLNAKDKRQIKSFEKKIKIAQESINTRQMKRETGDEYRLSAIKSYENEIQNLNYWISQVKEKYEN